MSDMKQQTEQWASKLGFILATAGSAIGLGAIWKFPYIAGKSGGGAFFLIFLLFTVFIGMPILRAVFVIWCSSQNDAIRAYKTFAPNSNWHFIGVLGMLASFFLLLFYSVVGGWILLYSGETVIGNFSGLPDGEYGLFFHAA